MRRTLSKLPIKRIVLIAVIVVFVISLIPIFAISLYNYPSSDDFSYGVGAREAFADSGSPFQAIKAAADQTLNSYNNWQGTFSAVFLMALQPDVWGGGLYFLSTLILVISFIGCTLFFSYNLLTRLLKADKAVWLIVSLVVMGLCMQFLPSPVEAFYWFNGSIFYTFFFSLSLFLFGLIIGYITSQRKRAALHYSFIAFPLAFFIGGGNFVTALVSCLALCALAILLMIRKNKRGLLVAAVFLVMAAGFIISAAAPGNAIRMSRFTQMSPVMAVLRSFVHSARFIAQNTASLPVLIGIVFCLPFLAPTLKNTKFKFEYPLLIFVLTFCLFSAQFTPALYATGNLGPVRLDNIRFFAYIWFALFNAFYLLGWGYRKMQTVHSKSQSGSAAFAAMLRNIRQKYIPTFILVCALAFFASCAAADYRHITSVSAWKSLSSGEAAIYDSEVKTRLELLNSDQANIVFLPYSVRPYVIYHMDIKNPANWRNTTMARYYGKESLELKLAD